MCLLKEQAICIRLHDVVSRMTAIIIVTTVRTSNLAQAGQYTFLTPLCNLQTTPCARKQRSLQQPTFTLRQVGQTNTISLLHGTTPKSATNLGMCNYNNVDVLEFRFQ